MAGDEGGVVNCLEPHPTMPVLATSGLDHDVKIWVPSCEEPEFKWTNLRKLIKENSKERERERREQPDMIDAQMFSIIMQHFRRMRQRRDHDNDGEQNESSDDTDVEENSDDDEENDSVLAISPCRTS